MKTLRLSKTISFSLMGIIVLILIGGTIVEQLCGTEAALRYCYAAPWTIAIWLAAVLTGGWYIVNCLLRGSREEPLQEKIRRAAVFGIHLSFVVILAGALCTHLWGEEGSITLRIGESTDRQSITGGRANDWLITLDDFRVQYYPGTRTPEDYVSTIRITPVQGQATTGTIAMNSIFRYRGWRFYQSSYDADAGGCTLLYTHDPLGIGITYAGYILLLLSILVYLTIGQFYNLTIKRGRLALLACCLLVSAGAAAAPTKYQHPVAESFGSLYVEYNGRVCPMSTVAADVCTKLYGHPYYRAEDGTRYTANQVFMGLLFDYDSWRAVPLKQSRKVQQNKERETVQRMAANGTLCKIWQGEHGWYDINSVSADGDLSQDEWRFRMYVLQYVASDLVHGRNIEANETLKKIRLYQQQHFRHLPDERRFRAEQAWATFSYTLPLALVCMLLGIVLTLTLQLLPAARTSGKTARYAMGVISGGLLLFLTAMLAWRWYISGHIPMTNGHETMQSLAWFSLLLSSLFAFSRKGGVHLSAGLLLVAGIALMVSNMSASNPQITHLMPVLQSPLLSLHVGIIMLSYALFALLAINSVIALCRRGEAGGYMATNRRILSVAVCCLAIGIFLGAVWANVSWGRYWGWDPKEVWALITMLLYAAPLHGRSLPFFRRPRVFHLYCLLAFLSVLFTYFGVNFLLGGMHAYQ